MKEGGRGADLGTAVGLGDWEKQKVAVIPHAPTGGTRITG